METGREDHLGHIMERERERERDVDVRKQESQVTVRQTGWMATRYRSDINTTNIHQFWMNHTWF